MEATGGCLAEKQYTLVYILEVPFLLLANESQLKGRVGEEESWGLKINLKQYST